MENRKNQIISLAFKLIQEKGFVAISYDDLSKPLGVTKASIHYYFEKKEDLGAAILERMMERLEQLLLRIASLPPEERLEHYFSDRLSCFGMQDICPLSSLQADFESLPEALQHKVKEVSEKELFILIQILKAIQEEGGIDSAAEIEPLAIMILAGGKGILQYQRVFGRKLSPVFFKQINRLIQ